MYVNFSHFEIFFFHNGVDFLTRYTDCYHKVEVCYRKKKKAKLFIGK